jgi:hypothetical protein
MYDGDVLQIYVIQALPPVHIIVKNGDIILDGVVAREMDKIIAYHQANSLPGVFLSSITFRLRDDPQAEGRPSADRRGSCRQEGMSCPWPALYGRRNRTPTILHLQASRAAP